MKTILIAGLLVLACSTLATDPTSAQIICNNQVGLYTYPDGCGPDRATMLLMEPVRLYLVLCRPCTSETGYVPLASVNGFECALRFDPVPSNDLFLTDAVFHPEPVVVTDRDDMNGGVIDLQCGYATDVPVTGDAVVLVELEFLSLGAATTDIYLEPIRTPSIPGAMAYCEGCPSSGVVMHPVSGSHELPVFQLQAGVVAYESMSFGGVKALFR